MNEPAMLGEALAQKQMPLASLTKIEHHKANPANDLIEIVTLDEKGAGGAHHRYLVFWPEARGRRIASKEIEFQDGPIKEHGVNGLTQEVLLAIVQHRLECFQAGEYACAENEKALAHVRAALEALKERTRNRQARDVEGTSQK